MCQTHPPNYHCKQVCKSSRLNNEIIEYEDVDGLVHEKCLICNKEVY